MSSSEIADPDGLVGQTLDGRYRIVECIGEGGMGAVYAAEHLTLQKEVAVKVIHPEFAGHEAAAQRFAREAMVTSRFSHPNIISALDFGTLETGSAYLVMELVRGRSFTDVLESEGTLPWARACDIAAQIADALTAAKQHDVIHRDLKPDNVLIVRNQDGSESAKILDFGVAKFARDSMMPPGPGAKVTRAGMVIGTPGYMAPEQAIGESSDHRSDLYALGVLLWESIVGRRLFDSDDLKNLIRTQLAGEPPSVRAAAEDLTIPDELDQLVAGLLRRDSALRPDDPSQVRDLLRQLSERGRGSGAFSLPDSPLAQRLAAMAEVAKRSEDHTPSGIVEHTPMTGAGERGRADSGARTALLMMVFLGLAAAALVSTGQLEVTPKGDLRDVTAKIAPKLEAVAETAGAAAVGTEVPAAGEAAPEAPAEAEDPGLASGLPPKLQPHLRALIEGEARGDRVAGAEALLGHMPMDDVPGYARILARFQLEASCDSKKAQLDKLIALPDTRALPGLVMNSQRAKDGCGAANRDCLGCMREELDALIEKLEAEVLTAQAEAAEAAAAAPTP